MPAPSKASRRMWGWIEHTPEGDLPPKYRRIKERTTHQQQHDFAATKEAGLPERVHKRRAILPRAAGR